MRIVDVCGFYAEAGGGVRRYVDAKFAAAARSGHVLTVVAPGSDRRSEPREGGSVEWIASPAMPFDPRYRRFAGARDAWRVIDAAEPNVIEGSSPWGSGAIAAGWPGRAPRALVFHQDVVAAYGHTILDGVLPRGEIDALAAPWWARLRRLSAAFDVTVTPADWLAERLVAHGVSNACAVPFGVEGGRFSPNLRDETLRAELIARCGLGPSGRLALAMARFHPEKRLPMVIDAVARAQRKRPDLGLVVIGEGLARGAVERAARRTPGVALIGAIDDRNLLARTLASGDLFVHGSAAETYGLAVAEAIVSGVPVVVPREGGAGDLARRGVSAVYRTGAAGGAARAIVSVLNGRATAPTAPTPGTLDAHFAALFEMYAALGPRAD